MFVALRTQSGWLLRQTFREIVDDNCAGLAAQLAFYFLLALFPALLFLVALVGYLPIDRALTESLAALGAVAPTEFITLLRNQVTRIKESDPAGLLTLGVIGALWSSSAGMVAIIDALNRAYDVTEWRPWWKRRLVAVALSIMLTVFIVLSFALILLGPGLASRFAAWLGLGSVVSFAWNLARWPAIVLLVTFGTNLVYYFAPNRTRPGWTWITPGAVAATLLWIGASLLFKLYIVNFGDYTATYGAIGAAIVTMLWFYVSGLAMLVGAELNGVLEQNPSLQDLSP